ncbi:lamin tail domain-containing protein [Myxococcus qinghaiensis]|uniref:lamin tail domain-containing protein n=1 Tax=Myxococcus qinghaiensis TaxID=2906758 RepID=UPI0020A7EB55|nr:lamin tail domain-containing protein [Myxococcus qinghaiensis]MCP3164511.1 lamin tail domain-containing protein [Myxococcus qinghaiensis]
MSVRLAPSARLLGLAVLSLGLLLGCGDDSNPQPLPPPATLPDATASTVVLTPTGALLADGQARGEVTVIVKGKDGALLAGRSVMVAVAGEGNTVTQAGLTNSQGVAVAFVVSTRAGEKRVTVSVAAEGGAVVLASQPSFTFVAPVATRLAFSTSALEATAGAVINSLEVRYLDSQARLVPGATAPVTLSLAANPGAATLEGTLTVVPVDGVARFTDVVLKKAGAGFQLLAAATGVENATTETFTVVPAEAASLELAGLTATAVAGAAREAQVTVHDAFGNVATNYTGTLAVRSTDATATLPASHVFTATDAGHFTFTGLVLKRAGSHQVTVQDVGVATLSGHQDVGVVAGEPSTLAFTQVPTSGSSSTALSSVEVSLQDGFGNTSAVGAPVVTVSLVEAGDLSGVLAVAPVEGVARFTGLRVSTEGSFHLRASAPGLTATDSAAIAIVDDVPPARPVLAVGTLGADSATVTWVAVGDDGNVGRALSQTLRYSLAPITTAAEFDAATPVGGVNAPAPSGTAESAQLTGLSANQTYHVALRVVDNRGNAALSNSLSFQTLNSEVTQLAFTPQPVNGTAGQSLADVGVSLLNAQGEVVTESSLPVTLTLVGGTGFEPKQVSAASGVALFSGLRVDTTGTYRFQASANGLTVQSAEFVIAAGAPSRLVLTGLVAPVVVGQSQSVEVTAFDDFNNVAQGYTGAVRFTSTDPAAELPADYTFTAQDQGRHVFTDVVLMTSGLRRVTATDTANAQLTAFMEVEVTSDAGHHLVLEGLPAQVAAGSSHELTLSVRDGSGNLVTGYTGEVDFASDDPRATLPPEHVFTAEDAGRYTFSVTLETSGGHSITVSEAGSSRSASQNTQVSPGAAASLTLGLSTTTPAAGQAVVATVTLVDAYGNQASGYRGTVALSVAQDPGASVPGAYTFTEADAGRHVFSVTFAQAQETTLSAVDTQQATLTASEAVTVSAGVATALHVAPVTQVLTAGVAQSFSVSARDRFGNLSRDYVGTVQPSSTDAQAGLLTAHTYTAAEQGEHLFNLTLRTAGTQTVTFSDAALAVSEALDVTVEAAAPERLGFVSVPASASVRQVLPEVRVAVQDAFGNTTSSQTPVVTLALSGGGVLEGDVTATAVSGVARFSTLSVVQEGDYTLTASVSGASLTAASTALTLIDDQLPAKVASLEASVVGTDSVRLRWVATGDDGQLGQAASYQLRYSLAPLTETNFEVAVLVPTGAPGLPGTQEEVTVPSLPTGRTYHFAVRVLDGVGNTSLLTGTSLDLPGACGSHVCAPRASECSESGVEVVTYEATCEVLAGEPTCRYVPTSTACPGVEGVCYQAACTTAAAPGERALIITEIMASPSTGTTEYIEVTSTSDALLNINGLSLISSDTSTVSVDRGPGAAVVLPARGILVLASNADFATNGGVAADHGYGNALDLEATGQLSLRVKGVVMDDVTYDEEFPLVAGRSLSLSSELVGSTASRYSWFWCASSDELSGGDRGTPGLPNETCGVVIQPPVEFCAIESPKSFPTAIAPGSPHEVTSRVYEPQVTTRSTSGNDHFPYLVSELGYGTDANAPESWTWVSATPNPSYGALGGNDDEMLATLQIPANGSYLYGFRYRFTRGPAGADTWVYCDQNGVVAPGVPASYGTVTVDEVIPVSDHVVISEVSGRGVTSQTDEFVELHNPTNQAVDLSGWMLQYKSATGTTYSGTFVIPAGKVIPAHGYFLLAHTGYTGTGALAADAMWSGFDMSASTTAGGHVRIGRDLTTSSPIEVDKLGWGTANTPEGTTGGPSHPAAGGSIERKALPTSTQATMAEGGSDASRGNGSDTNNNAADFVIRAARQPQNSASGTELP